MVRDHQPRSRIRKLALLMNILQTPMLTGSNTDIMTTMRGLDDKVNEYETLSGKKVDEDLLLAVVLKIAPVNIRTELNLRLRDDTTYAEMVEIITGYDIAASNWSDTATPMEVDRIHSEKCKICGKTGHDECAI